MKHSIVFRGSFATRSLLFAGLALGGYAATAAAGKSVRPVGAGQTQPVTPVEYPDTDGDGLPDALEQVLGTSPTNVDTDGDGFSDSEEVARQSDPTRPDSVPGNDSMSVGLAVSAHDGSLHAISVLYFEDGVLADKSFQLGAMMHGNVFGIDPARYDHAGLEVVPSNDPAAVVAVVHARLPSTPLHLAGSLSLFSTVAGRSGVVESASAVDLVSVDGVILQREIVYHLASTTGTPHTGSGAGGLYIPLGGTIPANWNDGQVCAQTLAVIGVEGPVVTQEVDSASCEDSLEGACSPGSCSASVGTTIRVMDPVALIGG